MTSRELKFFQSINEAIDLCMAKDPAVYIMGLGVPDPKGLWGTTLGLQQKYGSARVLDMPLSENGMTGVAIGSALVGMRPIMTHQRIDFAVLAMEQIVNQAAQWHYMFGGQMSVPLVIRMIIGRGWGQGTQHSQSLQALFAHVPGLKVVMPATSYDAKGLLIASIEDNNPVIFIEHRWLHNITGHVPEGVYRVPLGRARVAREGNDVTIAATSHMTLEALRAAEMLAEDDVTVEVIDIRTLKPLDEALILESVRKTGRLIVADTGWQTGGFSAEVVAQIAEEAFSDLKSPPRRVALPDCPTPTTPALANHYYPRAVHIVATIRGMLGLNTDDSLSHLETSVPLDVPDKSFTGPF
ncbi:MAG: Acetoin:2,6-dichlorophenolindophenol oxidoreductase subunit beta [Syntrophomonadaceae bacterium]|nr:Acetoin:2,6-dichlorophenolindophenol oxidoreductase subunit beta [Bacillota bacterium]MBT9146993.1 Acetoin:2,6-dichlorophenolindophenol oxidoreductase subunit beta [Bacillota bacterium]